MQNFLYKFLMPFFMIVLTIFTIVVPSVEVKALTSVDFDNLQSQAMSNYPTSWFNTMYEQRQNLDIPDSSLSPGGAKDDEIGAATFDFLESVEGYFYNSYTNAEDTNISNLNSPFVTYWESTSTILMTSAPLCASSAFTNESTGSLSFYLEGPEESVEYIMQYIYPLSSSDGEYTAKTRYYNNSEVFYWKWNIVEDGVIVDTAKTNYDLYYCDSDGIFQNVDDIFDVEPDPTPTPTPTPTPSVNEELNNIQNSITDESGPTLGSLSDSAGWLPAGPVDSIINLPLTFFQSVNNALSKTCVPVTLPLPFVEKAVELPCVMSLYEKIDGLMPWVESISMIASAFILYKYLLHLYKWVDDTLTFRENTWADWGGV